MVEPPAPYPLFPPLSLLYEHVGSAHPINHDVRKRLDEVPTHLRALSTWRIGMDFLVAQRRQSDFKERHYNILCPIIESIMHWSWSIRRKALSDWHSGDARDFIQFIMQPPISWVSSAGGSRYSRKARQDFADKPINDAWRPIFRKGLSGTDPGLSSKHHLNWFLARGREFFAYYASVAAPYEAAAAKVNPFRDIRPKDFEKRQKKPRTTFTPEQLGDLLKIAESLAQRNEKWEAFLFMAAVAVHSEIPMRALGSTATIKATFSHFKARDTHETYDIYHAQNTRKGCNSPIAHNAQGAEPSWFESPHYPGRRYKLNPAFAPCYRRFAQFRHKNDPSVSSRSFLFPLDHGADAYGNGSLIGLFSAFTANILKELQSGRLATSMYWKWSEKLRSDASLTFLELRNSAKHAGMIPKAFVQVEVGQDVNVWPDIGIRQGMPASQWFRAH